MCPFDKCPLRLNTALLHAPGIWPDAQHLDIVIRFEQQHLHAAQMHFDRNPAYSGIGGDANFDAFGMETKAHRIDGIVRNGKALDSHIADHPARSGLERFDRRRFSFFPIDRGGRQFRDKPTRKALCLSSPVPEPAAQART